MRLAEVEDLLAVTFVTSQLKHGDGEQTAYKVMTNSVAVAEIMDRKVEEPMDACDMYLNGLEVERKRKMGRDIEELNVLEDMCDLGDLQAEEHHESRTVGEDEEEWKQVAKWRAKEIATFREVGVCEYATRTEMKKLPEHQLIDTIWVDDFTKGKSRLCAREFAGGEKRDDLFAPTPSLLATKWLIS